MKVPRDRAKTPVKWLSSLEESERWPLALPHQPFPRNNAAQRCQELPLATEPQDPTTPLSGPIERSTVRAVIAQEQETIGPSFRIQAAAAGPFPHRSLAQAWMKEGQVERE